MVAGLVVPGLEVEAVDGPYVGVVVAVNLLPVTAVDLYRPELVHLHCITCGEKKRCLPCVSTATRMGVLCCTWY